MKKTTKKATETKRISKEELSDYVDRKWSVFTDHVDRQWEWITVGEISLIVDKNLPVSLYYRKNLEVLRDKLNKFLGEKR